MTIRPRGKAFMVDVKVAAAQNPSRADVRVRVTANDRDSAVRLETLIRAEVLRTGRWTGEGGEEAKPDAASKRAAGTLKAALDLAWKHPTRGWSRQKAGAAQHGHAKWCVEFLGPETMCREVTENDFNRLAVALQAKNLSSDTVTRKLQALYRVLWHARKAGWIKARPEWERPAPGQPRMFIFKPELEAEVIAYFKAVEQREDMADVFCLGIDTGARLNELLHLEVNDIDLSQQFVLIRGSTIDPATGKVSPKNGEVRQVGLLDRAHDILKRKVAEARAAGRKRLFPGFDAQAVGRLMRKAREHFDDGNDEFVFHATRHTCGTRLAEAGLDAVMIKEQLGHKTLAVTMRYIKMSPIARRNAIRTAMGQSPVKLAAAN